jgi:16S rRNA U1498 N3-methylase RsmE
VTGSAKPRRFFVGPDTALKHDLWVHHKDLVARWRTTDRLQIGEEVVLFDGELHDKLYKLVEITPREAHVQYVTDFEPRLPRRNVYLLWSLADQVANDRMLQVGTAAGVSHFLPLISAESDRVDFVHEQASVTVVQAAEESGRSDIPTVREPLHIAKAIEQLSGKVDLYICSPTGSANVPKTLEHVGLIVPSYGVWSGSDGAVLAQAHLPSLLLESEKDADELIRGISLFKI